MSFPALHDMPLVIVHLHDVCNQRCPYCVGATSLSGDFGRIGDPEARRAIGRFFAERGPYQILLTGGEPLITPGLLDMVAALAAQGHRIALQSNLRSGAARLMRAVRPEQTSYIAAAFHSVALQRLPTFLGVVRELKARGYPIVVKLVLDEVMSAELARVFDLFAEAGVGVLLAPRVHFPAGGRAYPEAYSAAQWREIAPRMTMVSSWLYFSGGWRSRGRPCAAGQRLFHARATTGAIHGCAHSFPRDLGDLYADSFEPLHEMPTCGLEQCICDFHTYVGVTPGLDDSSHFRALLSGPSGAVPFGDYLAFVQRAAITPCVDLVPTIVEGGVWDGEAAACAAATSEDGGDG